MKEDQRKSGAENDQEAAEYVHKELSDRTEYDFFVSENNAANLETSLTNDQAEEKKIGENRDKSITFFLPEEF